MKYLVVRFRQMGDAVIATCLLNTIRENDPEADITFVLNQKIEPLFRGHPSIDHIITFTEEERHSLVKNFGKMWRVVRQNHYDVIIDMRSTVNTMGFALFSPRSRYRIGLRKSYTRWVYNRRIHRFRQGDTAISHDLDMLRPLGFSRLDPHISLFVTDSERQRFAEYLQQQGIGLEKPIVLVGVSAKLDDKKWPLEDMAFITKKLIERCPNAQIVFNFAPGKEAADAKKVYELCGRDQHIFLNVEAKSQRELSVLATFVTFYFGNEGGARHIMHAHGKPSFVVVTPGRDGNVWIPKDGVPASWATLDDLMPREEQELLPFAEQYKRITPEYVWNKLSAFLDREGILTR